MRSTTVASSGISSRTSARSRARDGTRTAHRFAVIGSRAMSKPAALAVALLLAAAAPAARAQVSTATPIHHGKLLIRGAAGRIDDGTGIGTLRVRRWPLTLADGSNGIFPGQEPAVVALGEERYVPA